LLGDDEATTGSAVVRDMDSKAQDTVAVADIPRYFRSLIKGF
jgi:histidyl-tRNA synthetase